MQPYKGGNLIGVAMATAYEFLLRCRKGLLQQTL